MRKPILIIFMVAMFVLPIKSEASEGKELGLMIGGGFNLRHSLDSFSILPYYSTPFSEDNPSLRFLLPLAILFGTGLPEGYNAFGIFIFPGIEYDANVYDEKLFISPTFALELGYQQTSDDFGDKIQTFAVGFLLALQLKFQVLEHLNLRFVPVGISVSPWSYSNQGIGSQTDVAVAYQLFGGAGYTF